MQEQEVLRVLGKVGAVITDSHIVYTSDDKHGTVYVNKDALLSELEESEQLAREIARQFVEDSVEVVLGPVVGGALIARDVARELMRLTNRKVRPIYADREENGDAFIIRRGYDKIVAGKKVLVVEDVLTTGGSVKKVIEAARALGGKIVGLGALWNRGGIKPEDVANPPKLFALVNVKLDAWDEAECPLCDENVPINTDVGKGREYLARKKVS